MEGKKHSSGPKAACSLNKSENSSESSGNLVLCHLSVQLQCQERNFEVLAQAGSGVVVGPVCIAVVFGGRDVAWCKDPWELM